MSLYVCPSEIIYHILKFLSYRDIKSFCCINRKARTIGCDTYFWINKLDYDMGHYNVDTGCYILPSKYIVPSIETGESTYLRWINNINTMDMNNHADIIIFRLEYIIYPESTLNRLYKVAIKYSKLDILKKLTVLGCVFNRNHMKEAIYSTFECLDWLILQGLIFDDNMVIIALYTIDDDGLDWLESRGIVFQYDKYIHNIITTGLPRTLDLLYNRGYIKFDSSIETFIDLCMIHDVGRTLSWLETYNILPNQRHFDIASRDNNITVCEWLLKRGIYPSSDTFDHAVINYKSCTLEALYGIGTYFTQDIINRAMLIGNDVTISWFLDYKLFPDHHTINILAGKGNALAIESLAKHNMLPDVHGANEANRNGHRHILYIIQPYGIIPNNNLSLASEYITTGFYNMIHSISNTIGQSIMVGC